MLELPDLRLPSLMAARLCHELVAPITAIGNGAELLAEGDPDFAREATGLVAESARRAASRLQFYRFAYGFGGGDLAPGPAPCDLAIGFFEASGIAVNYPAAIRQLPLEWQKLACNLLLLGREGLPRGGALSLEKDAAGPALQAIGDSAALAADFQTALAPGAPAAVLTVRTVQARFTALLA
ncbi:MAG TPA: histidine phosphotransferase family protein, partial [Stellaceae bacterium]|nr:histidine phosphotransferase family protein [Stellaceae bacterium]